MSNSKLQITTKPLPESRISIEFEVPADFEEANKRNSSTGKERSSRRSSSSFPTAPLAPSTATVRGRLDKD